MDVKDYFDIEDADRPFVNGTDDTIQYISWYDMFLEAALHTEDDADTIRAELKKGAGYLASRAAASAGIKLSLVYGMGLSRAAEEYGLYGFGFFCLIMAAAQEIDAHYHDVCSMSSIAAADGESLNLAMAEELYRYLAEADEVLDMRRLTGALQYCPLFTFHSPKPGKGSLYRTFEANRQFAAILKGDYTPDRNMSLIATEEHATGRGDVVNAHEKVLDKICSVLSSDAFFGDETCIIQLTGGKGSGKSELILQALPLSTPVIFLSFKRYLAAGREAAGELLSDVLVRCRLLKEVLVVTDVDMDKADELEVFLQICASQLDLIFIETHKIIPIDDKVIPCRHFVFTLSLPRAYERLRLWESELSSMKMDEDVKLDEFSRKYLLNPGVIHNCVIEASGMARAKGSEAISSDDLTEAVLSQTTSKLDELCDRIPLKYTWDDMVLDPRQKEIMETLCSRIRYKSLVDEEWGFEDKVTYGKGVSMILYGSPGTGKTMAAQVMARDIGMALYRVDLSQLVDKYIGETEKNIGRIFDAASDGNVILFFDEADALFSKRTEVQSSNDKHANTEVAYLLQKIEQHDGVTFLATNRFADFDSAFMRRLTYAVRLERPDASMRLKLYEKIIPDRTPKDDDLDLEFFADTFELSGSEIKEVLYSAAFIAASSGEPLGNRHLVRAVKYQQEKTGKLLSNEVFGRYGNISQR